VTVVDAVNWAATAAGHDEAVRQVALADTILVSKLDLPDAADFDALVQELRTINPAAEIARIDFAPEFVAPLLMRGGFDAADPKADPTRWLSLQSYEAYASKAEQAEGTEDVPIPHHLAARGIESFVLTRNDPLSREEVQFLLDGILQNLGPSLLRVKGLVNIGEEPGRPAVIQGAQHLLHSMTWLERWPSSDQRTRIVFITQGIARDKLKEIIELLDRMSARTFEARERARLKRLQAEQGGTS
jgi:G3E family GTPase